MSSNKKPLFIFEVSAVWVAFKEQMKLINQGTTVFSSHYFLTFEGHQYWLIQHNCWFCSGYTLGSKGQPSMYPLHTENPSIKNKY